MTATFRYMLRWIASLFFALQMYLAMTLLAVVFVPLSAIHRDHTFRGIRCFTGWVRFSARWIIGLQTEIRGEVPQGNVLICGKHQSFLDILLLCDVLPRPRFVMKRELLLAPIVGYIAVRMGCIAVDRGRKAGAVKQLLDGAHRPVDAKPSQLVIFPQGTRVAPGVRMPYKVGAAALYEATGLRCVPTATNVGVFWPRRRVYRSPGVAVVEFLDAIPPGLDGTTFLDRIEHDIETASDRLMEEAGFVVPPSGPDSSTRNSST